MAERKLIDADGHIREIESDVFEYLPEHYKTRRDAVLYFPLLPHHGWHRQAGSGGMGASFLVPTLEDWQKALDQGNIEAAAVYPTRFMHIGQVGMVDFAVDLSRATTTICTIVSYAKNRDSRESLCCRCKKSAQPLPSCAAQ
jgi:hypothetical protein